MFSESRPLLVAKFVHNILIQRESLIFAKWLSSSNQSNQNPTARSHLNVCDQLWRCAGRHTCTFLLFSCVSQTTQSEPDRLSPNAALRSLNGYLRLTQKHRTNWHRQQENRICLRTSLFRRLPLFLSLFSSDGWKAIIPSCVVSVFFVAWSETGSS